VNLIEGCFFNVKKQTTHVEVFLESKRERGRERRRRKGGVRACANLHVNSSVVGSTREQNERERGRERKRHTQRQRKSTCTSTAVP